MHRKTPLTLSLVKNLFLKEGDNHENILIPVGTAIINVAAVKYALVSTSKPTVYIWCKMLADISHIYPLC